MAASSLNKGWLTSLVAPTAAPTYTRCRFINARPIIYLKIPHISFIQNGRKKVTNSSTDDHAMVESLRDVIRSSVATAMKDSTTALADLYTNIATLTLNSTSEDALHNDSHIHTSSKNTSSNIPSKSTASADLSANQQIQHGPIHFHRRAHKTVHSHNILSGPSPFTSDGRTYTIPKPHAHPPNPLTINVDPRAHIRPSTPEPISPTTIKNRLQNLFNDKDLTVDYAERERRNPFPHLDQNYGWNRALCAGKMYFSTDWTPFDDDGTLSGGLEAMTYIKRRFAKFSLWAQREAMEFDEEDLRGENGWGKVFDMVFKGEGVGLCWARIPGSWHAVKPGLLTCCRSVSFYDEVLNWTEDIRERVRTWRAQNQEWRTLQALSSKRRFKALWPGDQDKERFRRDWLGRKDFSQHESHDDTEPGVKRIRIRRREPEKIATEEWRTRRREQEKKAGRWLDGTIRQDRMWAEFHWVLNPDDPREHVWPRKYRYYFKNGVRYWYRAN
ncbi:hypothetical protein BKA64DRAFT_718144 [Cadophora sp. MPI-SDFR-AT-0126]|nr:hypothetical protein BKA64DRAFT_718144 [Leotiomycetes sp. MPI-SDFR-AT-0126]